MADGFSRLELLEVSAEVVRTLFVFAYGASIGSLTNVLVYRLPLGLGIVVPSSRCPLCGHRLGWRDNIPVLGWLFLRGRCRYCAGPIGVRYPLVEASVGVLFVVCYLAWYGLANWASILDGAIVVGGLDLGSLQPEWAANGLDRTWVYFVVLLILVGSLVAMTLVDARTFMIPLVLAWTPAAVGVAGHGLQGWVLGAMGGRTLRWAEGWSYAIASPGPAGWGQVGLGIGGVLGLGLSLVLVRFGVLRRSFEDFDRWEREEMERRGFVVGEPTRSGGDASDPESTQTDSEGDQALESADARGEPDADPAGGARVVFGAGGVAIGGLVGGLVGYGLGMSWIGGMVIGVLIGPIVGGAVGRVLIPGESEQDGPAVGELGDADDAVGVDVDASDSNVAGPADLWLEYPHARREMVRELVFLGPVVALALVGWMAARRAAGPWETDLVTGGLIPSVSVPLWLDAVAGALVGYLVGGAVVWAVRVLGSVLFRKEAMGLGDVHLMAGVGACVGWIDPVIAFFLAAPVGLYVELVRRVSVPGAARRAMPFGPSLAAATVLVLIGKPGVEWLLGAWLGRGMDLP